VAQPYVGEIRIFAGNFAPAGWMMCNGQLLPISENETLFQLIGTTYGGDGQSTFGLPDLQSRVPIHMGTGSDGTTYQLAETGGVESVTLTVQQIPTHSHTLVATGNLASAGAPSGQLLGLAQAATITPYGTDAPLSNLNPSAISATGGSQPHDNLQPYVTLNFIISLFGIFPSPT
jgi:microcystin-dependent protein